MKHMHVKHTLESTVYGQNKHHFDLNYILGCEVYGRWSDDAVKIVREMAALKAQQAPRRLRNCARHAWSNRWWALIGVGVQRAIAEALLRPAGFVLQDNAPLQPPPPLADLLLGT